MADNPIRSKIIVICGPTGIGETAVGIELAQIFKGEIISADSMQIYRHMNIGTAKPDADDPSHDEVNGPVLWGNLMAGGAGVEWYFGYKFAHSDLNCEDWHSRDAL